LLTSSLFDGLVGRQVVVKAESFQRTGSFKFRGAYSALSSMRHEDRIAGVIGGSSGNHGQALALAARLHRTRATVVLPDDAPVVKRQAIHAMGAQIITYPRGRADRDALVSETARRERLTIVPSADDRAVIAGAGTVAWEMIEEMPNLAAILVPVGGGGLAAGTALAAGHLNPRLRVIGVEPASANDTLRSLRAGRRMQIPPPTTIADGLTHTTPAQLPFEIMRDLRTEVVTVSEEDIARAMAMLWQHFHTTVEPSGAVALAALLRIPRRFLPDGPIGVVVSGGNVDWSRFRKLVDRVMYRRSAHVPVLR
jgi:threonine dehydratase